MGKLLELLMQVARWPFRRRHAPAEEEQRPVAQDSIFPDNFREFVRAEVTRARMGEPWGENELAVPPILLSAVRSEISRQVQGQYHPGPTVDASIPAELSKQLRQLIQEQLEQRRRPS